MQVTVTSSIAASLAQLMPRSTSNENDAVGTSTEALRHTAPWSPDLDHRISPAADLTRSVPIAEPYM